MSSISTQEDDLGIYIVKSPETVIDFEFDWTDWIAGESVGAISTSVWGASTGLTVDSSSVVGNLAKVMISGGSLGFDYYLTNIVTAGAKTDSAMVRVKVRR